MFLQVISTITMAAHDAMTKTGPNDAYCVVWALGMSIFLILVYCFIVTDISLQVYVLNDELHDMEKNERWDGGNGPKRRVSCRLGLRYVFLIQFIVYYIVNHIYYCIQVLTSTTTTTTRHVTDHELQHDDEDEDDSPHRIKSLRHRLT